MPPVSRRNRSAVAGSGRAASGAATGGPAAPRAPGASANGPRRPSSRDGFDAPALRPRERVEVKLSLQDRDFGKLARALGFEAEPPEEKQVVFLDTPDRSLYGKGVVLRFQLEETGDQEATVKLRPVDRDAVPRRMAGREGFKLETDLVGARATPAASYSVGVEHNGGREIAAGNLDKLFTERQEDFVEDVAGVDIDWDRLHVTAPSQVAKWEFEVNGVKEKVTVERWKLPDGTYVLEVSAKTLGAKADAVREELQKALARAGVKPSSAQETKTLAALRFLR